MLESNFQHKDTQNVQLMKIIGMPHYGKFHYDTGKQQFMEQYLLSVISHTTKLY